MTTTYHTPISTGAAANAATFNTPFSQLDSRLVQLDNAMDTDGTLKAGAVDNTAVLADDIVTDAKMEYPVRLAHFGINIGSVLSSVSAHTTSDTEWDVGLTSGNFAFVSRAEPYTTAGIVWDAWVQSDYNITVRATNVTASTVNINAATIIVVCVVDLQGGLAESSESQVV